MSARSAIAVTVGAVGFLCADLADSLLPLPRLLYLPLEHRWLWARTTEGLAMDLYGHLLWCLLGASTCFAVGWLAARSLEQPALARWAKRLTWVLLTLLALCTGLYVSTLSTRQPVPLSLPQER